MLPLRIGFMALAIASELAAHIATGQSVRVTSWNLGISGQTRDPSRTIIEAANVLKNLDSDIVLLQGVKDWSMCSELAELARPGEYHVLVCSAFHAAGPLSSEEAQVAILSKQPAYFTWSEAWASPGDQPIPRGMVFAAIDSGSQRLGLFSVLGARDQSSDELGRKVLDQVSAVGHWETNQVQTFVIGASFDREGTRTRKALNRAARAFDKAGFVDATEDIPAEIKSTLRHPEAVEESGDVAFAGPAGYPVAARITSTPFTVHYPTTFDLELNPEKVTLALDIRRETRREQQELFQRKIEYWTAGILGSFILIASAGFLLKRRSRKAARRRAAVPGPLAPRPTPGAVRPIIFAQKPTEPPAAAPARGQVPLRISQRPRPVTQSPPRLPTPPQTEAPLPPQDPSGEKKSLPPEDIVAPVELDHGPELRHGVIRELTLWLKQKFVRKLITDRAQLMEAQMLAARMANTLDTRLARIEAQIQAQNQAYVRRIEELNKELAAAREENRELIRERIAQVKAEMEAARARVLAEAQLDSKSIRL
ncbi:MAG TPA: hypothetical protein VKY92_15810 [Verrucomicrobiae bacterium]|nr:hypothetical protein [Verrucomicrobiae bacterium]